MRPEEGYQIALERIAKAKAIRATQLDLSCLGLREIPESIVELKDHLKVLLLDPSKEEDKALKQKNYISDISPLKDLSSLKKLSLESLQINDISILSSLTSLEELSLTSCKQISDISAIGTLTCLRSLNLERCFWLSDISPLKDLPALTELSLRNCANFTDITSLGCLSSLEKLHLGNNAGITDYSVLGQMTSLKWINISSCGKGKAFPKSLMDHSNLDSMFLHETYFNNLPRIFSEDTHDQNDWPAVRSHFNDMKNGSCLDREINVLVLGNVGSGKTTLCRRLIDNDFHQDESPVHKTNFWRWKLNQGNSSDEPIIFNMWDFGAHDLYYASHRLFHKGNTIVIVCRDEQIHSQKYYEDKSCGLKLSHRPPEHWSNSLKPESMSYPVIDVQTKCKSDSQYKQVQIQGNNIYHCRFSAESNDPDISNKNQLIHCLKQAADQLLGPPEQQQIGKSRWKVRQELMKIMDGGIQRISISDFNHLCVKYQVSSSCQLLDFFEKTGKLAVGKGLRKEEIILDLRWICELADSVYNPQKKGLKIRVINKDFKIYDISETAFKDFSPDVQKCFSGYNLNFTHLFHRQNVEIVEGSSK